MNLLKTVLEMEKNIVNLPFSLQVGACKNIQFGMCLYPSCAGWCAQEYSIRYVSLSELCVMAKTDGKCVLDDLSNLQRLTDQKQNKKKKKKKKKRRRIKKMI